MEQCLSSECQRGRSMRTYERFAEWRRDITGKAGPDIVHYNELPEPLRIQVLAIWRDAFGGIKGDSFRWWVHVCREFGREIADNRLIGIVDVRDIAVNTQRAYDECAGCFMKLPVPDALLMIQYVFTLI